ncbi:hypothetical protein EV183_000575 [Coemansia sp. RSA 2336]|nr:hypothetical protein EV183_000575 [Coemansia sp. RSA 2336]
MECSNALAGLGEPVSTAEAAAIRVLVVPVGQVRAERFWSWIRELTRSGSMGAVRLDFVARTGEHEHLEGLQTHRQVLGVMGLIDGATCKDIADSSAVFAAEVANHATAVASQCLAYDADADAVAAADGVIAITTPDDVRVAADELAGALVSALNVMAATLEEQDEAEDATARRGAELEREQVETQPGGGSGRLHKLRGDVLLMAGRATEALGEYTASIEASELVGDRLWQAAAAEGYCAALVQLAARDSEAAGAYVTGMPGAGIQIGSNSDAAAVAAGIAEAHELVPKMMQQCHAVAPILIAEASIRAAQAVQAARAAGEGKAEQALRALAQGQTIRCALGERRSAVAEWAGRAWDCVDGLDLPEQLRIAAAAGTVTSAAGLWRRAAFYLRQFVLRAVPLLMRAGRAEHAAQTAFADGAAAFAAVNAQAATGVTGHGLPPVLLQKPGNGRSHGPALPDGLRAAVMGCVVALEHTIEQWPSLRADILRACMAAAAVLPSPAHAAAAAVQLASCLQEEGPKLQRRALADEQHILRGFLQRTAAQLAPGQAAEMSAALSGLLVSIQHIELTEHTRPERTAKADSVAADSLFLHNPSAAAVPLGKLAAAVAVAGECSWFVATLHNPLPFALVLSEVQLLDAQDPGVACTVPAGSVSRVLLPLTPQTSAEQLVIRGISARVFQHAEIQCILADGDTDVGRRLRKRQLQQRLDTEKRSLVSKHASADILSPADKGCALNIVVAPALPHLSVVSSSSSQLPLSLFEGETGVVDLALANVGSASADWLTVSFEPSEGDAERREVVDAATRFCLHGADAGIGSCGACTLSVRIDGIPGLQNVCVVVRYGTNQAPEWSRVLRWSLQVSVTPLLVPVAAAAAAGNALPVQFYDLPPYIEHALGTETPGSDVIQALRSAAQSRKLTADQFCMAEVSLSNAGASDLQLLIEVDLGSDHTYTLESKVPAHASLAHVTVPFLRVHLSADEQNAPVPGIEADGGADTSLFYPWRSPLQPGTDDAKWQRGKSVDHGRQFVIPRQTSSTSVKMQRVFYWTKQALAERVRVRWTCVQSQRTGFIDPRTWLQLDQRQLAVVRPRLLQMHMFVDGNEPVRAGQQLLQARCQTRHPTHLAIKLSNQSLHAVNPLVSVQVVGHPIGLPIAPVDAWAHQPGYKERLAAAAVSLPNIKNPRFRFKQPPAVGMETKSELNASDPPPEPAKQTEPTHGIVLDNISQLLLPEIPASGTSELALPLYVSVPGRYHIDIAISDKHGSSLVREILMIN